MTSAAPAAGGTKKDTSSGHGQHQGSVSTRASAAAAAAAAAAQVVSQPHQPSNTAMDQAVDNNQVSLNQQATGTTLMQLQEVTVPTEVALQNMAQGQVATLQMHTAPQGTKRVYDATTAATTTTTSTTMIPVQQVQGTTGILLSTDQQMSQQQHMHHQMAPMQIEQQQQGGGTGNIHMIAVDSGQPMKRQCVEATSAGISTMAPPQDSQTQAGQIEQPHQMNVSNILYDVRVMLNILSNMNLSFLQKRMTRSSHVQ